MGRFSHVPVCGAYNREPMTDRYRVIRVDNDGYVYVTTPAAAPLSSVIYGHDGSGTPSVYRNYPFSPSTAGSGQRGAYTAVAVTSAALTVGKHYQFMTSNVAWIRVGGAAVTAVYATDFFTTPYAVYTLLAATNFNYIAFVRDTTDGVYYIGQAEA